MAKPTRKHFIGRDHYIDKNTGELLNTIPRYKHKLNKPKFIMLMKNDEKYGLTGNEFKLLVYLAENAIMDDNRIYLVLSIKEQASALFGLKIDTITNLISSLTKKGWLIRESHQTYRVSSDFAWKGDLNSLPKMENEQGEERTE